jgi:hypothetical protein
MKQFLNKLKTKFAALLHVSLSDWLGRKNITPKVKDFSVEIAIDKEKAFGYYSNGNVLVKMDKKILLIAYEKTKLCLLELEKFIQSIKD